MIDYEDNRVGLIFATIVLIAFMLVPYYVCYKCFGELEQVKKEFKRIKNDDAVMVKMLENVDKLLDEIKTLKISENKWANKYCLSVKYSTNECRELMLSTARAIDSETTAKEERKREIIETIKALRDKEGNEVAPQS